MLVELTFATIDKPFWQERTAYSARQAMYNPGNSPEGTGFCLEVDFWRIW